MTEKVTKVFLTDGYMKRADGMNNVGKSQIAVRPPPPAAINVQPATTASASPLTPAKEGESK